MCVSYLLRVHLQYRPGSLGLLAVQLGSVGADILPGSRRTRRRVRRRRSRGRGGAGGLPDSLITAAEKVKGVRVDSIRPYSGVLDTHRELELIDQVATAADKLQVLVDNTPRVLRVSWATVITSGASGVLQLFGSSGAPETPLEEVDWLPCRHPSSSIPTAIGYRRLEATWTPGWPPRRWAAATKAILLGRIGGPDFRPSEVARLGYLAGIVSTVLRTSL